jgi:HEAT repeat protein
LRGKYGPHELLSAATAYGERAHALIDPRVRRGDAGVLYVLKHAERDPHYVPAVRDMFATDASPNAWHSAVYYLWNIGTPEAVGVLREAYDGGRPHGAEGLRVRLLMAESLAYHHDHRGLPDAWTALVDALRPTDPPADKKARKDWEDEREDMADAALDVFARAESGAVVEILTRHANDNDPAARLALLDIMTETSTLPDSLRPRVELWKNDASADVAERATELLATQARR